MKRFFSPIFFVLLIVFFLLVIPFSFNLIYGCGYTKYVGCGGTCPDNDICKRLGDVDECGCVQGPQPPTPKPTNKPVEPCGGTCPYGTICNQSTGQCVLACPNDCGGCDPCNGGYTAVCNKSTCECGCVNPTQVAKCTNWSGWSGCTDGVQTRNCIAPSGNNSSQQRTCPTNEPNQPTNTPTPNVPSPTAYIRVRTYNPDLTPVALSNDICKVNCTDAPCTFVSCVSNDSLVDFAGAASDRGGGIKSSGLTVMGITPVEDGVVSDTGTYYPYCRGIGTNYKCYTWPTTLNTGSRVVRFIVATNTPIPTPTVEPGPWIKLKNASFVSGNNLSNHIPVAPATYDPDDNTDAVFITTTSDPVHDAGIVSAPNISLTGLNSAAKPNSKDQQLTYSNTFPLSLTSYINYIKSRKAYTTITSLDDPNINKNGIYFIASNLTITSEPSSINNYHMVIISTGTITINTDLTPDKSIAMIAPTINFGSSVALAEGIFISNTMSTGTNTSGLKIVGNVIAQDSLTNGRTQSNVNQPSLFIVFDQQSYIDLLPYLSTASYEWKQIQ